MIPKVSDNIVCKVSCPLYPIEITTPAYFIVVQLLSRILLGDPMDYSTTGFPVLHYLLEFAQIHVH